MVRLSPSSASDVIPSVSLPPALARSEPELSLAAEALSSGGVTLPRPCMYTPRGPTETQSSDNTSVSAMGAHHTHTAMATAATRPVHPLGPRNRGGTEPSIPGRATTFSRPRLLVPSPGSPSLPSSSELHRRSGGSPSSCGLAATAASMASGFCAVCLALAAILLIPFLPVAAPAASLRGAGCATADRPAPFYAPCPCNAARSGLLALPFAAPDSACRCMPSLEGNAAPSSSSSLSRSSPIPP